MKYISLFTGIGGFDLGFDLVGMQCALQVEKDKNAQFVLNNRWTNVPKLEDVRNVTTETALAVDLICGGFPCQDVSVAGKREGLAGERSGLWFEFRRIIDELKPKWVVIENVPGLLSSNDGRDMGAVVGGLAKCGYWWAYRVLDAQFYGVPQRRRRVFIVASLTAGNPQKVLFEPDSSPWDTPPSRETGQKIAGAITSRFGRNSGGANDDLDGNRLIAFAPQAGGRTGLNINVELSGTLQENQKMAVAFQQNTRDEVRLMNGDGQIAGALSAQPGMKQQNYITNAFTGYTGGADDNDAQGNHLVTCFTPWDVQTKRIHNTAHPVPTLAGSNDGNFTTETGVRRLTPLECERLQGFPDGWTAGQSDTQRYRQLGNAVAVPVAYWLGKRIVHTSL